MKGNKQKGKKTVIALLLTLAVLVTAAGVLIGIALARKNRTEKTDPGTGDAAAVSSKEIGEITYSAPEPAHYVETMPETGYIDNELAVVAEPGVARAEIERLAKEYGAEIVGVIEKTGDYQWRFPESKTREALEAIAAELMKKDAVAEAYPNLWFCMNENEVTQDVNQGDQRKWKKSLQNDSDIRGESWGMEAIRAPAMWRLLDENKNLIVPVAVGVIDTGVYESHKDLPFTECFYNANWEKLQTETDKTKKKELIQTLRHGTRVTGILAANGINETGICGVYPYAELGGLYAANWTNFEQYSENINNQIWIKVCLAELILHKAKVINCSFGANDGVKLEYYRNVQHNETRAKALEDDCIEAATDLGRFLNRLLLLNYDFLIIGAAGNSSNQNSAYNRPGVEIEIEESDENGSPIKRTITYETQEITSTYNSLFFLFPKTEEFSDIRNRVINVGSFGKDFNKYYSSCTDADIYAPGEDLFTTEPENNYIGNQPGTSLAAPHVAGTAACIWSVDKSLTGEDVRAYIIEFVSLTHRDLPTLDAFRAVEAALRDRKSRGDAATETDVPNAGSVFGFVVDRDTLEADGTGITQGAIENAKITLTNEEGKTIVKDWLTDDTGHFECFLPQGNYTLTVIAEGYADYTWKDPVAVKAGKVTYLSDWIKLTRSAENQPCLVPARFEMTDADGSFGACDLTWSDESVALDYHWSDEDYAITDKNVVGTVLFDESGTLTGGQMVRGNKNIRLAFSYEEAALQSAAGKYESYTETGLTSVTYNFDAHMNNQSVWESQKESCVYQYADMAWNAMAWSYPNSRVWALGCSNDNYSCSYTFGAQDGEPARLLESVFRSIDFEQGLTVEFGNGGFRSKEPTRYGNNAETYSMEVQYTYDAAGNVTSLIYTDSLGGRREITVSYVPGSEAQRKVFLDMTLCSGDPLVNDGYVPFGLPHFPHESLILP